MALTLQKISEKIIHAKPQLLKILVLDVRLKAMLRAEEIIDDGLNDDLEPLSLTPRGRVDIFLDDIKRGPVWRFLRFCKVMHEEGKPDVLAALDVNIDDIESQLDGAAAITGSSPPKKKQQQVRMDRDSQKHSETPSTGAGPISSSEPEDTRKPLEQDLLTVIYDHCKYYKQYLKRVHIFAFDGDPGDDYIDITPLYIKVDPQMKDQNRRMVPIAASKILEKIEDSDPPLVVRLYGQPGDGKTSFTMNIAYSWSVAFMEQVTKMNGKLSLKSKCPLWTTMVFIKARDIKTTMEDAIREGLGCKEEDEETMMAHIKRGEGVAILVEAMDELHDQSAIEELKKYVKKCKKNGGPTVLITARTDLCCIDGQDFDRFLTLEGFSEKQALQYIKLYTESCKVPPPTEPPLPGEVLEHVTKHKEKMKAVLSNPLQLHLYCALVMRREIELNDTVEFSIPNLFCPLERYLCKRGSIKVTEEQSNSFYKFCMHAILMDMREFPKALLEEFNIDQSYYVFMNKSDRRGKDGELQAFYSFGHEMILEYFASRYIYTLNAEEQLSLILVTCCDESWRNIQCIIFQMLAQEGDAQVQLMQTMLRSILILQSEGSCMEREKTIADLMHLREHIKGVIPSRDILRSKDGKIVVRNVDTICEKISNTFEMHADQLRAANWLSGVHSRDESSTFEHVLTCLRSCPLHLRTVLIKNTVSHLIPGKLTPDKYSKTAECWFHRVGDARWAIVNSMETTCTVAAWCPADATEALLQEMKIHPREGSLKDGLLLVACEEFSDLWGPPDNTMSSKEQWSKILHMASQRTAGYLSIRLGEDSKHLSSLFSCIQSNAKQISHSISISGGKANLDSLMTWVSKCRRAGVDLTIHNVIAMINEKDIYTQNNVATLKPEVYVKVKECTASSLECEIPEHTALVELLPYILDHSEQLTECKKITVIHGTAELKDLVTCELQCKQKGLKLTLQDTRLLLSGSSCETNTSGENSDFVTNKPPVEVVLSTWTQNRLALELEEQTPLGDVLLHLLDHSKHMSDCASITVKRGTTTLHDLMTWVFRYKELGLDLCLYGTDVLVREHIRAKIDVPYRYSNLGCTRTERQTIQLRVNVESHILLTDLLSHILDHAEYLTQCEEVDVSGGTAEIGDLMMWVSRCRQKGLKLKLQDTHLLMLDSRCSENKTGKERHCGTPRPALQVTLQEWSRDWSRLQINLTEQTSPAELMLYLLDHAENLSQLEKIELHRGTAKLEDLAKYLSQCKEVGLKVELHYTKVRSEQLRIQEDCPHDLENILISNSLSEDEDWITVQLKHWTRDKLDIDLCTGKRSSLTGLLSWLLDHAVHFLQCMDIALHHGIADMEALIKCLSESKQLGLSLTLYNTCVIVSSEWKTQHEVDHQPANTSTKEALQIDSIHTHGSLTFSISEHNALSPVGLLSHFTHCTDHLSAKDQINVCRGRADLPDLMKWVTRCHQLGLHLVLSDVLAGEFLKPLENMTGQSPFDIKITEWNSKFVDITVDKATPLTGLLSYLHEHAADVPLVKDISVQFGTIELPDMVHWISNYHKTGLHLEFRNTHVVVPKRLLAIEDTVGRVPGTSSTSCSVEGTFKPYSFSFHQSMVFALPETTTLTGLLSWLVDQAAHLCQFNSIIMKNGTADLDDLLSLVSRCKEARLCLELVNVHIVLSDRKEGQEHGTCKPKNTEVQKCLLQLEARKLRIALDGPCSLTNLQSCLLEHASHLSQYESIIVGGGKADLGDLFTWVSQCRNLGLKLELDKVDSKTIECNSKEQCDFNKDTVSITVDRTAPLTDVVSYLLEKSAQLPQCKFITVHCGTATLTDLLTWVSDEHPQRPRFKFYDTDVIVAEMAADMKGHVTLKLKELTHNRFAPYRMKICLKDTALSHLLPCLLDNAVHLSQSMNIVIENVTAPLVELLACISKCKQEGIYLTFSSVHITMDMQQPPKGDSLQHFKNDGLKLKTAHCARDGLLMSFAEQRICQVTDLLSQLTDCCGLLSNMELIKVEGGMAELGELGKCVTKCQENGLNLKLCEVALPEALNLELYENVKVEIYRSDLEVQEWYGKCLHILAVGEISLIDLLSYIYDNAGNLSSVKEFIVSENTIELAEIVPWVCRYKEAGLTLTLPDTKILVPEKLKANNANYCKRSVKTDSISPVVMREWLGECLQIEVDETILLTGLLSHFQQHAAALSASVKKLIVSHGLVDLDDVVPWISKLESAGIELILCDTQVVVHGRLKTDIANEPEITPAVDPLLQDSYMGWGTYQHETTPLKTAPTLNPVVVKWSRKILSINLLETTPVDYFLDWLRKHGNHLCHCRRIIVEYGTTGLDDLLAQLFWYHLDGLNVVVKNMSIAIPEQSSTVDEHKVLKFQKLEIVGDKFMIDLLETTSVTCLLSYLLDLAHRLSWYDAIDIRYGTANLGDLLTCITGCTQAGLTLQLHDTCVLLSKMPTNHEDKHTDKESIPHGKKTTPKQRDWIHSEWMFPGVRYQGSGTGKKVEPQTKIVWLVDETLTIDLDWQVSVTDLLSVLLAEAVHLTHCQCIHVLHGTAELDALMTHVHKCRQGGLKLELSNTYITGQDPKYQTNFYFNQGKQGMDMKWTNDRLTLTLPTATPLIDVLSSLLYQPIHLEQCKEIIVKYGTAEIDDLMTCVSRYDKEGHRLRLYQPYVIVSDKQIGKYPSFQTQLIKDPEIQVMVDGGDIHTALV